MALQRENTNCLGGNPYLYSGRGFPCSLLSPPIPCLCALAFANEATFLDEPFEQSTDATIGQGLSEGDGYVLVRDGGLLAEEVEEACLEVRLVCLELVAERHLIHFETAYLLQQLTVWTELEAVHANIFAVEVAVLHLDVALQIESESAYSGQRDGIALRKFVEHDGLHRAQRSHHFALGHYGWQPHIAVLELHRIHRFRAFQLWTEVLQVNLFVHFLLILLMRQQSSFCD